MWLAFDSLVNARDLGGLPTVDGSRTRSGRLIRSDNLQELTDRDLATLGELGVTDVVDLRTGVEVRGTGPGPLHRHDGITVHHHSFYPEPVEQEAPVAGDLPSTTLPWTTATSTAVVHDDTWASVYLGYLAERPDSVIAGLRVIASADGATLVHCAAGKDRTGTLVALALLLVGVEPEAVVDDYVRSGERTERIVERLMRSEVYRPNLEGRSLDSHATSRETMQGLIAWVAEHHGDASSLLARHGWTDDDTAALRAKLLHG